MSEKNIQKCIVVHRGTLLHCSNHGVLFEGSACFWYDKNKDYFPYRVHDRCELQKVSHDDEKWSFACSAHNYLSRPQSSQQPKTPNGKRNSSRKEPPHEQKTLSAKNHRDVIQGPPGSQRQVPPPHPYRRGFHRYRPPCDRGGPNSNSPSLNRGELKLAAIRARRVAEIGSPAASAKARTCSPCSSVSFSSYFFPILLAPMTGPFSFSRAPAAHDPPHYTHGLCMHIDLVRLLDDTLTLSNNHSPTTAGETMADTTCARCPKPAPQATICPTCTTALHDALKKLPDLIRQLSVTMARENTQGAHDRRGRSETPLPIHLGAMEARRYATAVLTSWALLTVEEQPATLPADTSPASLAHWLAMRTAWLARHPAALDIVDEISGAADRATQTIDNRDQPIYWGPCTCGTDLYGLHDANSICCTGCKNEYDADARRDYLVKAAEDRLATTTEIEHLTAQLGQRVPAATVRQWHVRGHVLAHGTSPTGIPLYRVGDVLDRLKSRLGRGSAATPHQDIPRPRTQRLAA